MFIHSKWSCGCSPCCTHVIGFGFLLLLLLFFLLRLVLHMDQMKQSTVNSGNLCPLPQWYLSVPIIYPSGMCPDHSLGAEVQLCVRHWASLCICTHAPSAQWQPTNNKFTLIDSRQWCTLEKYRWEKSNLWPSLKYSRWTLNDTKADVQNWG